MAFRIVRNRFSPPHFKRFYTLRRQTVQRIDAGPIFLRFFFFFFCRLLMKTPGFSFEERSRSCLPTGFPEHIPGTCHFLLSYVSPEMSDDDERGLDAHIEAGLRKLTLDSWTTPWRGRLLLLFFVKIFFFFFNCIIFFSYPPSGNIVYDNVKFSRKKNQLLLLIYKIIGNFSSCSRHNHQFLARSLSQRSVGAHDFLTSRLPERVTVSY